MSIHLVVIDALNLIRRVYAAQTQAQDSVPKNKTESQAQFDIEIKRTSRICCQALTKIIQAQHPTHIVAVFDKLNNQQDRGWRSRLLPSYKADRKPMPEKLKQGMDEIQNAFWQLDVDSLLSSDDEADDLIATLAKKVEQHQENVTIVSTDKGYCQLLSPNIAIWDYFQQRHLDKTFVHKEFGVRVDQLPDYWGMVGISSSKIPGIAGIGPKTARLLLATYPNLEAIIQSPDLDPKYAKKIIPNQEMALVSRAVSYLKTDVELGFNLKDIRYHESHKD